MKVNPVDVFVLCKAIAPNHGLDPYLVYCIAEQECGKDKKDGAFRPDIARLEQDFYRRYIEPMNLATTSEILMANSYGLMQMMGESLRENGFFQWWFDQQSARSKEFLGGALTNVAVAKAIDEYCSHPEWNVTTGCQWFNKKLALAKGDIRGGLLRWNGGGNKEYDDEVLARLPSAKARFIHIK